jgi:hypothetical protein
MKGVMLGICPDVTLVDVTHEVVPHDVLGGALELSASYRYFPVGTMFLVVVDPGVGSERRGIAASAGGYMFIGPDNGVLAPVLEELGPERVVELTSRKYTHATVSRTFEGRDRFAPAAAWLAKGVSLMTLGSTVTTWERLDTPRTVSHEGRLDGEVVKVDRFGNLVTNIEREAFHRVVQEGHTELLVGDHSVNEVVETYSEVKVGTVCALFGSSDALEIAVNRGNAAQRLGLTRGAPVRIRRI